MFERRVTARGQSTRIDQTRSRGVSGSGDAGRPVAAIPAHSADLDEATVAARLGLPILVAVVGLVIGLLAMPANAGESKSKSDADSYSPRPTMRKVFEEIKVLVPLSLDETRWSAPESRTEILAALERLDRAAVALERHGRARAAGFDELALSLGRDLREARDHYAEGNYSEARFFIAGSMQNCVSCHVRLPSNSDFPFAKELTSQVEFKALDPREKAWLQVMIRNFDEALEIWEGLLADSKSSPAQLDASGVLVDYLNVVLRVRTDIPRAQKTIAAFAKRKDLPLYLTRRVDTWKTSLEGLDASKLGPATPPDIDAAERLAKKGGELASGPYGRDGLVEDLAAASQLVRFLENDRAAMREVTRNRTPKERASASRAYYWLGIVEARSLDGFWINLSERHFEAAIRADPKGPFAERAYAQLEEIQVLGYGGASGDHLPADVWTQLRELRELMGRESPASTR